MTYQGAMTELTGKWKLARPVADQLVFSADDNGSMSVYGVRVTAIIAGHVYEVEGDV